MHRLRTADATPAVGQARVVACAVLSALAPRDTEALLLATGNRQLAIDNRPPVTDNWQLITGYW